MESTAAIGLRDEAVVGLCLAAAGAVVLPARAWPLDAAFQRLAARLPRESPYAESVVGRVPSSRRRGTGGAERLLRLLATTGVAGQAGSGSAALWVFDADWSAGWRELLGGLGAADREAFFEAGQVLASCVSTWRSALSSASA